MSYNKQRTRSKGQSCLITVSSVLPDPPPACALLSLLPASSATAATQATADRQAAAARLREPACASALG